MTETFVAVQDALSRSLVPMVQMKVKEMPKLPRPWYLPEAAPSDPAKDLAKGRAQMARLAARHPRNVKGYG